MPDASFTQTSFLGGEWSQFYQGRTDDPRYLTAMNVCVNAHPLEEGVWVRRSGFRYLGPTWNGNLARIRGFNYQENLPFTMEFTEGVVTFWSGPNRVLDSNYNVLSISATTPVTITVDPSCPYNTNDNVMFWMSPSTRWQGPQYLMSRVFTLTKIATGQYSLKDMVTGTNVTAAEAAWWDSSAGLTIGRVLVLNTPYTGTSFLTLQNVQFEEEAVIFNQGFDTQVITGGTIPAYPEFTPFTITNATWTDGPFQDAPTTGVSATVSGPFTQGTSITLSAIDGLTFTSADVGNVVNVQYGPAAFDPAYDDSGFGYSDGHIVYEAATGLAYVFIGIGAFRYGTIQGPPSSFPAYWSPVSGIFFATCTITAVNSSSSITVTVDTATPVYPGLNPPAFMGGDQGYETPIVINMQKGYGATFMPQSGAWHEGRLWCSLGSTIFASVSNEPFSMLSVNPDGTVADDNAINYTLESGDGDANAINWMNPGPQGLVCGSLGGEWLIRASQLDDPITPTSIQARRVTKYGTAPTQPVRTGLALVFIQRYQAKLLEFIADVFTGKHAAPNLSLAARHIGAPLFQELAYQETPTPIVWTRDGQNNLAGITYRRLSSFITEAPTFAGWHRHFVGDPNGNSRAVASVTVVPIGSGTSDTLTVVTGASTGAADTGYSVQQMEPLFDETSPLSNGWFLDDASPAISLVDSTGTGVTLYGYWHLRGTVVTVFIAGLNCGTYTVSSIGSITVPYQSDPDRLLTASYLETLTIPSQGYGDSASTFVVLTNTPAKANTSPTVLDIASTSGTVMAPRWSILTAANFTGSGTQSVSYYNLTTGAQISTALASTIMSPANPTSGLPWGFLLGSDGYIYFQWSNESRPILYQVTPSTMVVNATFGDDTNGLTTGPLGLQYSTGFVGTKADGTFFLISQGNQTHELGIINGSLMGMATTPISMSATTLMASPLEGSNSGVGAAATLTKITGTHGTTATLSTLLIGSSAPGWINGFSAYASGTTYAIGAQVKYANMVFTSTINSNTGNTPTTSSSDWELSTNPYIILNTAGTLVPSQIDATWTHFFLSDMGWDTADGNVIVYASTDDTVTQKQYLVKLSTATAAVIWKVPVGATNVLGLNQSNIEGLLAWQDSSNNVTLVNTITGAIITTYNVPGLATQNTGGQSFDSVTGNFLGYYTYNSATSGAPPPAAGSATSFTDNWALYAATTPGSVSTSAYTVPAIAGYAYTSQGQILRPGQPQTAGSANGPPLGKTRRLHMFSALLNNTPAISFGTTFSNVRSTTFKSPGGTLYAASVGFSGVYWAPIDDAGGFDSMICWQVTGPYPANVMSVGGFLQTQDR